MTGQQTQAIESVIDRAIEALPNGDEQQLMRWVTLHINPELREAMADEGEKDLIRERAPILGVTLTE